MPPGFPFKDQNNLGKCPNGHTTKYQRHKGKHGHVIPRGSSTWFDVSHASFLFCFVFSVKVSSRPFFESEKHTHAGRKEILMIVTWPHQNAGFYLFVTDLGDVQTRTPDRLISKSTSDEICEIVFAPPTSTESARTPLA
jgi:hypothetical protein